MSDWFSPVNANEIASPALLLFPDRIRENIRRMIAIAGDVERLRPHMKTHKLAEVIQMQMEQGITKFKCATIAEVEMTARCGAPDILLAYPLTGPNVQRLIELAGAFPNTRVSVTADDAGAIRALSAAVVATGQAGCQVNPETQNATGTAESQALPVRAARFPEVEVLLDLDVGQHRTGVAPGPNAIDLYRLIASLPGLKSGGLHAYDGHVHDSNLIERTAKCEKAFVSVATLRQQLIHAGLPVPRVVAGGTPTFPMHAKRGDVECSPGTCILWDAGYATNLPDLEFLLAAVMLSRVVSRPGNNRLCLDLGHKAVASEMLQPRVQFLNLPDAMIVGHNEEHMIVESLRASGFKVGDCIYALPWHICPTVALHSEAVVVESGRATQRWKVVARERKLRF